MTERIIFAILPVVSALLAIWITHHFEAKKRESEEKRWYADYFLGRKIDALNNLYAALVDCHFTLNFYGNCPPSTLQEFKEKIQPKQEAYLRAMVMASIYLDEKAYGIMSNVLGSFRQASMAIWLSLPNDECPAKKNSYDRSTRSVDWKTFVETYEKSVVFLKNMLSPKVLEHIEKSK